MSELNIKFGDRQQAIPAPATVIDAIKAFDRDVLKKSLAAKVNGEEVDLSTELSLTDEVLSIEPITADSTEGLEVIRHSTAHLLAAAVLELFPGTKLGVGPALMEDPRYGFYYDVIAPRNLTEEDLPVIEKKMREMAKRDLRYRRDNISKAEILEMFKGRDEPLKCELIDEKVDTTASVYYIDNSPFIDFCLGPHVPHTGKLQAFKLLALSGAYWKGDAEREHIGILLALRQNPGFNQYYLTRMLDLWNTTFSCENLLAKLDSTENLIDPEMAQHSTRWSGTYTEWKSNVAQLRTFITNRCIDLTTGFMSCYNLTGPHSVTVDAQPAGTGTVQFNSVNLTNLPWTGTYFGNIGSNIIAKSLDTPYHFASWSANSQTINPNVQSDTANLILTNSDTLVAHFINPSSVKPLPASGVSFSVYPTLINSSTTITYQLAEAQAVQLSIYSSQGKLLTSMVNPSTKQNAGTYTVQLDFGSSKLAPDVYLIKLNAGNYSKSIKVVYLP